MRTKRWVKAAVAVAVAAVVGVVAVVSLRPGKANAAPAYETAAVTRGRIAATVTASGTLSPLVTVQVGSQISGRVQALLADFNSTVKKGQVIARIDPSLAESQVAQARANEGMAQAAARSAEAAAVEARRQHARTEALVAKDLVAQAEADTSRARLDTAEAELVSARARIAQARAARVQADTNLAYTTITSPIDGVVISRDVDVGQTVAASLQAPTLFTLAEDLRKMEVHTDVAESDVGRVTAGLPVQFTVDAYPGERFAGEVKEVRYAPKTVQNVVTYDAVVSVDNSSLKLRPGMTADVSFLVEEIPDTLMVPNAALRFRPPGATVPGATVPGATPPAANPTGRDARPDGTAPGATPNAMAQDATPPAANPAGARASAGRRDAAPDNGVAGRAEDGAARGQRPARDEGAGDAAGPRVGSRRVVWVLSQTGTLRPVEVKVGASDGKSTAVLAGELAEGDRVATGLAGAPEGAAGSSGQSRGNPRFGRFL